MKNHTTQLAKSEKEGKALNQLISILTIFIIATALFSAGYYVAVAQMSAMLNN